MQPEVLSKRVSGFEHGAYPEPTIRYVQRRDVRYVAVLRHPTYSVRLLALGTSSCFDKVPGAW